MFFGSPAWYAHALPQDETGEGLKSNLEQSIEIHGLSHAHLPEATSQTPLREHPPSLMQGPGGGVGGGVYKATSFILTPVRGITVVCMYMRCELLGVHVYGNSLWALTGGYVGDGMGGTGGGAGPAKEPLVYPFNTRLPASESLTKQFRGGIHVQALQPSNTEQIEQHSVALGTL